MRGMRIRYRGAHATQKWDISSMGTYQPSLVVFKRWQTGSALYAAVHEMNVFNPWWWRPRGQLINRVHPRVYIAEHKTETMSIVYCTATTNHCDNKHSSLRWFWYRQARWRQPYIIYINWPLFELLDFLISWVSPYLLFATFCVSVQTRTFFFYVGDCQNLLTREIADSFLFFFSILVFYFLIYFFSPGPTFIVHITKLSSIWCIHS